MKLLIVLSIIAYGYADKLDRAYLPPSNAATAGGSPGSLLAPGVSSASGRQPGFGQTGQIGFGQTGQSGFGGTGQSGFGITGQPGLGQADQTGFAQTGQSGIGQTSQPGFGQTGPSQPGFGQTSQSGIGQTGQSGFGQGIPSTPGRQPGYGSGPTRPSYGGVPGSAQSGPGYDSGIELGPGVTGSSAVAASGDINAQVNGAAGPSGSFQGQTFGSSPQPKAPFTQGFGQGTQDYNVAQAYKPERSQAAGDRNAEILKYINENDGEKYTYSYETSNGISAEETGEATNGVKAQGGFSYTGDDGQKYSLTYTADENGFLPQGDHLPTPHPIPAEILKSLEENARAAAAGTQEGAYRPEEYETEGSPQYNTGISSYNRPQGQIQGFGQGSSSPQGPTTNQGQNNQFSANQGGFAPNRLTGQSNQFGQPSQDSSKSTSGSVTPQGPNGYQQGLGASNQGTLDQFAGQGSVKQGLGQPSQQQGQGSSGYNYNQPQNTVGSVTQFGSGSDVQNRPQINGQGQISSVSGTRNGQGTSGLTTGNLPTSATSFEKSQGSRFESPTDISSRRPQNQLNGNAPSLSQPSQNTNQGSLGSSQGYQYQQNTNRPTFGNTNQPSGITSQPSQGSQYNTNQKPIGANNGINQGTPQFASGTAGGPNIEQGQQNVNRPSFGGNVGSKQGSSSLYGVPNTGTGSTFGQANQPPFGSNSGPSQGSSQFGQGSQTFGSNGSVQGPSAPKGSSSIQAPYQYNRPTQSFPTQPQLSGSQGESSQYPGVKGSRPGIGAPGSQGVREQYPGISSSGPQGVNVQRPGQSSPGNQGVSGPRPGVNVPGIQVANGQYPGASSPGSQGVTVQRPDQSSYGNQPRPGAGASDTQSQYPGVSPGSQSVGQRPSGSSPGASGRPGQGGQSGQEQFGGPRQPPSFSPQEGYKY